MHHSRQDIDHLHILWDCRSDRRQIADAKTTDINGKLWRDAGDDDSMLTSLDLLTTPSFFDYRYNTGDTVTV